LLSAACAASCGAATSAPCERDSRSEADDSDEPAVDGCDSALGDIDSRTWVGDSKDTADEGSEPAAVSASPVGDCFGLSAGSAGTPGSLDAGSGAVAGPSSVMVRRFGGCVGFREVQYTAPATATETTTRRNPRARLGLRPG
jgi:hypothetical protein